MRVPALGKVCRRQCQRSNTSRVELSPADRPKQFGHMKPADHRPWIRDSRQACRVETRRQHAHMSSKMSATA